MSPSRGLIHELRPRHQRIARELFLLLHAHVPPHLEVDVAPMEFRLGPATGIQSDLVVTRHDQEVARVGGDETWTAQRPCTVTISLGEFLRY